MSVRKDGSMRQEAWRAVSIGMTRRVGTWLRFRHPGRGDCDEAVAWFLQRVYRTPSTDGADAGAADAGAADADASLPGASSPRASLPGASLPDASSPGAGASPPGAGASPADEGRCSGSSPASVDGRVGSGHARSEGQGAGQGAGQGEGQGECEGNGSDSAGQGCDGRDAAAVFRPPQPVKRRRPQCARFPNTKQGRRDARIARQLSGVFLVLMNQQGRRMLQLVTATLEWRPAARPEPCVYADADMAADAVEPVEPLWQCARYTCPYNGCGQPSFYEDLCPAHAQELCMCRVAASPLAGLGVFAACDMDPQSVGDGDWLLFPFGSKYHLERDMDRYLRLPSTPAAVQDYLLTIPGTGVVVDGYTCRSFGSMLNHTDAQRANCAFVHTEDTFQLEAAVFVACVARVRQGDELLVCYNNPEWATLLGPGDTLHAGGRYAAAASPSATARVPVSPWMRTRVSPHR